MACSLKECSIASAPKAPSATARNPKIAPAKIKVAPARRCVCCGSVSTVMLTCHADEQERRRADDQEGCDRDVIREYAAHLTSQARGGFSCGSLISPIRALNSAAPEV